MRAQVVLIRDGRILLARHKFPDRTYWVLPGGSVEPDETPQEAAVREVKEETGLQVQLERLLFVDGPRVDGRVVIKRPRYTYLGRIVGGELQSIEDPCDPSGNHGGLAGAAWMPFDGPEYDAATRDTLELVKAALAAQREEW